MEAVGRLKRSLEDKAKAKGGFAALEADEKQAALKTGLEAGARKDLTLEFYILHLCLKDMCCNSGVTNDANTPLFDLFLKLHAAEPRTARATS